MQTIIAQQAKPDTPLQRHLASGLLIKVVWTLVLMVTLLAAGWHGDATASSLLYKDYIIRYDRGWDIMCEPYVVQKNDWVLKIFRQKGEIAHRNFRDFHGIFQRLNPHIKNIDMIRPGQTIDIPLRKLEHGTLPGQASGVVTIPFVSLAKVKDVVQKHSKHHLVKRGDTVSKLLARKYGTYGSKSYQEGIKLFQAANPQVTNLDRIYAGQKLYLPDPAIRDQSWYTSLYDDKGKVRQTVDRGTPTPVPLPNASPSAEPKSQEPPPLLEQAAAAIGGTLKSKGTYYLPRQDGEDFEMDLSRHPMLELPDQSKRIFTQQPSIMGMDKDAFESAWPNIKTVAYDEQSSVSEIVSAVFNTLEDQTETTEELDFEDQAVHVAVRAKWVRPQSDQRHICITPIGGPHEQTPVSIRRYLEQNGILIKELLPSGEASAMTGEGASQRHAVKNVLAITATDQKTFVKSLAQTLKFNYTPNISITFPYAGIQVQAYANLISTGNNQELLVDFGDLYGDAVAALRNTGLEVIQITAEDSNTGIVKKILGALDKQFIENPTFLAAKRPAQYNTTITIWGVLYDQSDTKRILLAGSELHPAVTDLLSATGIDVVVW